MSFEKCPYCKSKSDRAVYQCSNCGRYGCMEGSLGGFFGPYSGCWSGERCPYCSHSDTKKYKGRIT